jgi:alkylated DNA repair protein alkB family protein 1
MAAGYGEFKAEAGIINFYRPGDSLTGHVDRSELNMEVPLVSVSFGADCIFLLGGLDRDDVVVPLKVRAGDIIIMAGESRRYYHGVPRVIAVDRRSVNDELDDLLGDGRVNLNVRQIL